MISDGREVDFKSSVAIINRPRLSRRRDSAPGPEAPYDNWSQFRNQVQIKHLFAQVHQRQIRRFRSKRKKCLTRSNCVTDGWADVPASGQGRKLCKLPRIVLQMWPNKRQLWAGLRWAPGPRGPERGPIVTGPRRRHGGQPESDLLRSRTRISSFEIIN